MRCRISELQNKQVICMSDGAFLGYINEVEFDTISGKISAFVIQGRPKMLGLLGKNDDLIIPFEDVAVIGGDTVLIKCEALSQVNF